MGSMTTDKGQFLVIPTTEAKSLAFAQTQAGLGEFVSACEKRNIVMTKAQYVRFFVVNHCHAKKALKNVIDYWGFYKSIGYKNIVTMDVSAALQSHILAPPLSLDWVDMEGRPLVVFRGNLWFEGDRTQPTLANLKTLLMWIGEDLAKSVVTHYTGFTFLMDMSGWTRKNFSAQVYTDLLKMVQSCLPVHCALCILLDVPKTFGASWKLVSAALSSSFKKRMMISTRDDLVERFVDEQCLPPDLGGVNPAPDVFQYVVEKKAAERKVSGYVDEATAMSSKKIESDGLELTPLEDDDAIDDDVASRPGIYRLQIKTRANSVTGSPRKGEQKKLITRSSRLGFFSGKNRKK